MKLFNKNNNEADAVSEFRDWCPYLPKTAGFDDILIDIDNAIYFLEGLVGVKVLEIASSYYIEHYDSENKPDSDKDLIQFTLVQRVQHATAYIAYLDYVINRDVSHSLTGRKSTVDAKNERQAWEFMIERDDNGLVDKKHKAINRLLQFLESANLTDESGASTYNNPHKVVLNTMERFQQYYPIDDSRLLFIKLIPFQRAEQSKHILPIIGKSRLEALLDAVSSNNIDEDEQVLLDHVGPALALRTMAISIKRLSIRLMPEGVIQQFHSSIQSRKSSQPAKSGEKDLIVKSLLEDAKSAELDLANYIASLDEGEDYDATAYDTTEPNNSTDNKFFRI